PRNIRVIRKSALPRWHSCSATATRAVSIALSAGGQMRPPGDGGSGILCRANKVIVHPARAAHHRMQPQSNRGVSRRKQVSSFVQTCLQGLPHQHRGMAWTHPLRFWCFRALQGLLALASLMVIAWAAVMSAAEVLRWALV